ncbi:hypothetical protein EJB05_44405 [Eragrostis curvula]|uniref:Uncharacterized protein n=1 Tax=Eragrostis curvula TaxID=38414 RepID=A0A5J9THU1_9POAL|nr:hypothetical protein EJB05_44405 [Eragrostis curvula]
MCLAPFNLAVRQVPFTYRQAGLIVACVAVGWRGSARRTRQRVLWWANQEARWRLVGGTRERMLPGRLGFCLGLSCVWRASCSQVPCWSSSVCVQK